MRLISPSLRLLAICADNMGPSITIVEYNNNDRGSSHRQAVGVGRASSSSLANERAE
ncbi:hypothetical protein [Schaalia sp. ZJ1691]|uniref:hypothetical protein n=1 Tax=Schaalia sp. ZJ1691 TaxID=2709404 RepID=UPI0013ECAEC5|nr:hypothetical protein [Schaalia sp. ZJ1691]